MKEIITIQVGGYANFVGSHFWNLQDESLGLQNDDRGISWFSKSGINFDLLYRIGETREGLATYTPRLLAIDVRGSLGSVKATGSLYEQQLSSDAASLTSWKGKVAKHVSEPLFKNEFLQSLENEELECNPRPDDKLSGNHTIGSASHGIRDEDTVIQHLDDTVQYWTDYSKVHFHPLSLLQLEGIWAEITPFDDYGCGKGILRGFAEEDMFDRLRFFVEEADCMQGLQVLVDDSNGFAAVCNELLEAVNDEYAKSPVLLFTTRPPLSLKKPSSVYESTVRDLHNAIAFSALSSSSSHMIPFGLSSFAKMSRYLHVDEAKNYHTSAVYGAALSCMSLPLRMHTSEGRTLERVYGSMDMGSLVRFLSGQQNRHVSASELAMPAPPIAGTGGNEALESSSSKFHSLMEDLIKSGDQDASEAVVVQGASSLDASIPASLPDVVNCFGRKDRRFYHLSASACPLPIPLPFPNLFSSSTGSSVVSSTSIATKVSASVSVLPYLEKRLGCLQQQGRSSRGLQILQGWDLQKDDIQELRESISSVVAAYKDIRMESASDSE